MQANTVVPDICDLVEHGIDHMSGKPAQFRVTAWMKPEPARNAPLGYTMLLTGAMRNEMTVDEMIEAMFHEMEPVRKQTQTRLIWCVQEEATHVCLSGVCGGVAPISECRIVGRADMPEKLLAQELQSAHYVIKHKDRSTCYA